MKLPTEFKSLCSKVALERTRPAQWQTAAQLRADAQARLSAGRPAAEVQAWLHALLGDALKAQAKA